MSDAPADSAALLKIYGEYLVNAQGEDVVAGAAEEVLLLALLMAVTEEEIHADADDQREIQ